MKPCPLGIRTTTELLDEQFKALRKKTQSARRGKAKGIHGMRVASRRIRAIAKEREAYIKPKTRTSLRKKAKRITKSLGDVRELDVCIAVVSDRKDRFESDSFDAAVNHLQTLRAKCADRCDTCIAEVLDEDLWKTDADSLTRSPKKGSPCLRSGSSKRMKLRLKDVHDHYDVWKKSKEDSDLHQLRIAFKKFRYTCEAYSSIYGPNLGDAIGDAKAMQDALGLWNDIRMTQEHLIAGGYDAAAAPLDDERRALRDEFAELAATHFADGAEKKQRAQTSKPIAPCCRKSK